MKIPQMPWTTIKILRASLTAVRSAWQTEEMQHTLTRNKLREERVEHKKYANEIERWKQLLDEEHRLLTKANDLVYDKTKENNALKATNKKQSDTIDNLVVTLNESDVERVAAVGALENEISALQMQRDLLDSCFLTLEKIKKLHVNSPVTVVRNNHKRVIVDKTTWEGILEAVVFSTTMLEKGDEKNE